MSTQWMKHALIASVLTVLMTLPATAQQRRAAAPADGDDKPDPVVVSDQKNVQGIDLMLESFDASDIGNGESDFRVDSLFIAGQSILEGIPFENLPSGPQETRMVFSSPIVYTVDFDGNLDFPNLEVLTGPHLAPVGDVTKLSLSADGLVLNVTIHLAENIPYQMLISSSDSDRFDKIQQFYFGATVFPHATISGNIEPPDAYIDSKIESSAVLLFDRDIVDAFNLDETGLKIALESVLKGTPSKITGLQTYEEDDIMELALVRATDVSDEWTYELKYIPDGEYYVQLTIVLAEDVMLVGAFGSESLEQDPLPISVTNGESVDRLDIKALELDFGFRKFVGLTVVEVNLESGIVLLDSPDGKRIQAEVYPQTLVIDLDGEFVDLKSVRVGSKVNLSGFLFEDIIYVQAFIIVEIPQPSESAFDKRVDFTLFPQEGSGEWSLDMDTAPGDQGIRELNSISAGDEFKIELINNQEVSLALGGSFKMEFNPDKLEPVINSIKGIASQLGVPVLEKKEVRFTLAGLVGVAVDHGYVGEIKFRALGGFEGETEVKLVKASIGDARSFSNIESEPNATVVIRSFGSSNSPNPDFDGDGQVGFLDFIMFAQKFGSKKGDEKYEANFDLDSNGEVGFRDFILFAQYYGKDPSTFVPPSS